MTTWNNLSHQTSTWEVPHSDAILPLVTWHPLTNHIFTSRSFGQSWVHFVFVQSIFSYFGYLQKLFPLKDLKYYRLQFSPLLCNIPMHMDYVCLVNRTNTQGEEYNNYLIRLELSSTIPTTIGFVTVITAVNASVTASSPKKTSTITQYLVWGASLLTCYVEKSQKSNSCDKNNPRRISITCGTE